MLTEQEIEKLYGSDSLPGEILSQAKNPDWDEFYKHNRHVHDWRTYITDEVRENWDNLNLETRCVAINIAQACADRENWD